MLEEARENGVPFYKDYKKALKDGVRIDHPFEHEIPDTENYSGLRDFLDIILKARIDLKEGGYNVPLDVYKHIFNNYLHLSANYGKLSSEYIKIKEGDHHWLGNLGFVNHPIPYTRDKDGNIDYERENL